jgi:tetratricopeptide (TPR) repeat protein
MNRPLLGRIASSIFAFYAVSFLAFLAYAFLTYSPAAALHSQRWVFALHRAFVLFMDYLIPVHAAAIIVAVSLPRAPRAAGPAGAAARPFNTVISSTLVTFLILAAGYTVLVEGVAPAARRRISDLQYQARLAQEYLAQVKAARGRENYRAALDSTIRYLAIDPGNKEIEAQRLELERRAARQTQAVPVAEYPSTGGLDAEALMARARESFDREDWFTAHYFAQEAAAVDPRRTDAQRMAAESWDRLAGVIEQSKAGTDAAALYKVKKDAAALLAQQGNAVAAYSRLSELASAYPKDNEIAALFVEAGNKVKKVSFFLEDAHAMETLPGTQGILYAAEAAGAVEAVSIGKMVEDRGGTTWFFDIEAVRYDPAGTVAWHLRAPYGRREGGAILMSGVDRTGAAMPSLPVYLRGSRPASERNLLDLRPSLEELRSLSTQRDSLAGFGVAELWRLRGSLAGLGMAGQRLTVDMVMKLLQPFAFLVISLFALGLGWGYRARFPGKPSFFALVLIPLVPLMLAVLSMLYVHAHRVMLGFVVLAFGFTPAIIVLGALQVVLLAVALVLLAGQSSR